MDMWPECAASEHVVTGACAVAASIPRSCVRLALTGVGLSLTHILICLLHAAVAVQSRAAARGRLKIRGVSANNDTSSLKYSVNLFV